MKKLMKKLMALGMVLIITVVICVGCGASSKESSTEDGKKVYKLGISAYPAFYTWYICQAEGFFEKNNIEVELVYFPVYSDSVQAFSSGQIDMLAMAMPDVIAPYVSGIDLETVLILDNSNGADGLVVGDGVNSIADLKGKSVATEYGTIEHFFLLNALNTAGLTEDDINLVNLSIADSAPAFLSGSVDAACLWEPSLSTALGKEGSKLLISSEQTPGLIPDVLVVDGEMAKEGQEDIKNVINAYFDAMDFYVANEDAAIADMAEGAEITTDEMKVAMSGSKLFTLQECIDTMENEAQDYSYIPYTTQKIAEFLNNVGMIDSVPEDSTKLFNSSYLKSVLENRESTPVPDTKN